MTAKEFLEIKLGSTEYIKSQYLMTRKELEKWLDEYAQQHLKILNIPDVSKPKGTVCPDCGDYGWIYDETGTVRSTCPCHY